VITQNIVESMGGTINVKSEEGNGTELSILIQFRLAEEGSDIGPFGGRNR